MDDRTKILISLGAAAAANCGPCFEHYYGKAGAAGLGSEEVREAVELAGRVKRGAHLAVKQRIEQVMDSGEQNAPPCSARSGTSCCG